ncbi:HTH-type transcriptional repressor FabR [Candidatus Binatia bacterium]|nr:HTH-type transcriptional repressor FabR [Candidatus Binatia bacterium]
MSVNTRTSTVRAPTLRDERKQQTRQTLLDAALEVARRGGSLASISLREVAREAGVVPTAFYRHFRDMDELGLALVDDVCLRLRRIIREARTSAQGATDVAIQSSVRGFVGYVLDNARAFEFLTRERFGASRVVREAVAREIRYFSGELASDLRAAAPFSSMPGEDVAMIADLVVHTVLNLTADLLDLGEGQPVREHEITARAVKQLRLIFLGASQWRPERGAVPPPE